MPTYTYLVTVRVHDDNVDELDANGIASEIQSNLESLDVEDVYVRPVTVELETT